MKAEYEFYEIVKITSPKLLERFRSNELYGYIKGKAQDEESLTWVYGVILINNKVKNVFSIDSNDLQPTGKKVDPSLDASVGNVKIFVDPKTGNGRLSEE